MPSNYAPPSVACPQAIWQPTFGRRLYLNTDEGLKWRLKASIATRRALEQTAEQTAAQTAQAKNAQTNGPPRWLQEQQRQRQEQQRQRQQQPRLMHQQSTVQQTQQTPQQQQQELSADPAGLGAMMSRWLEAREKQTKAQMAAHTAAQTAVQTTAHTPVVYVPPHNASGASDAPAPAVSPPPHLPPPSPPLPYLHEEHQDIGACGSPMGIYFPGDLLLSYWGDHDCIPADCR